MKPIIGPCKDEFPCKEMDVCSKASDCAYKMWRQCYEENWKPKCELITSCPLVEKCIEQSKSVQLKNKRTATLLAMMLAMQEESKWRDFP